MSILCGTSFSDETRDAVGLAALLARRWNEPLQLVHAIDAPALLSGNADLRTHAREDAERRLRQEVEWARQEGPPAVEASVEEGPPDEVLVSMGAPKNVSLIVLGAPVSRPGRARRLGGTGERVAESSRSPVLVVRAASRIPAWLRGDRPLKIMVCDDLTHVSEAALTWTAGLKSLGPCEILVCHVYPLLEEKSRLGIGESLKARISEIDRANLAALERHAGPHLAGQDVRYRVEGALGRAAEPLLDIASDEAVDLVVVGTAHRTALSRAWHGWASQLLVSESPCSVASIPAGKRHGAEPGVVRPLRRVLAATDLSPTGDRAVAYAYAIVADGGTVHVLHVDAPSRKSEAHRNTAIERLRRLAPKNDSRVETQVDVVSDPSAAAAITAAAERLDVDAVCLGTHGQSGLLGALLGSVALEVAERCRRQVLLVPPLRAES